MKPSIKVISIYGNAEIAEAVSDYIESMGDLCTSVNDGKQGLEVIKKEGHNYDAIILDLAMPDFSGYDVLESLKNEGLLEPNNIILFIASSIVDKDLEEMVSIGVKTILRKPCSLEQLQETINRFRH